MKKRPYTIQVSEGQTLEDVAITEYGDPEGVFLLFEDNPGLSLDSDLVAGQELRISSPAISLDTVAYFQARDYRVNTGLAPVDDPVDTDGFDYTLDFNLA